MKYLFFFMFLLLPTVSDAAKDPRVFDPVIVVDKAKNQLHVTNYRDGVLEKVETFHATLGQKVGDKMIEGDLKTPEGIYDFLFRAQAPNLKAMFGPLAIYVSYPNSMDRTGAKTGFDILVHGTDDPKRLEKLFDSKGCVVLDNKNVQYVSDNIELKKTKIIITKDYAALENAPRLQRARQLLNNWLNAWSTKNIDQYIELYADEFRMDSMNRMQYGKYKAALNDKYETIEVKAERPYFFFHEKYDLIEFTQRYRSTFKGGATAFQMEAKKRLYIQERNGHYRIVREEAVK